MTKFQWSPLSPKETFNSLLNWQRERVIQCHEGGLWSGRWSQQQLLRGCLLYRYWWSRGLLRQGWEDGARGYGKNPYEYRSNTTWFAFFQNGGDQ